MNKKTALTIEVYTDEGLMHESIGGKMDFEDVRATMISILKNDGIPVIRVHSKEKAAECSEKVSGETAPKNCKVWEPPMSIHIAMDDIKFSATGRYEDVMDAQAEFLKTVFEEE